MNELKIVRDILLSKGMIRYNDKYKNGYVYFFNFTFRTWGESNIILCKEIRLGRLVYRNSKHTFTVPSHLFCNLIISTELYKLKNGVFNKNKIKRNVWNNSDK
jgi:hypothetical protein